MGKKIFCWLFVGMVVLTIDLIGYSACSESCISKKVTPVTYLISAADNDLTSQSNLFSQTEFEGRIFQQERKIQIKTNSGIKFVNATNYNKMICSAKVLFPELTEPVGLFHNLSFFQKLQI
jgi:hypothetical protein